MKRMHFIYMLFMLLTTFTITSCEDQNDTSGISDQKWSENQTFTLPNEGKITVTFTANSNWAAKSGADWCIVSPSSGEAGEIALDIHAANSTKSTRTTNVIVKAEGSTSGSTFQVKQNAGNGYAEDEYVNAQIDEYLKKNYLWNDEYKTLKPDFTLAYDEFLNKTLMSMKTNTLDNKKFYNNGQTYYELYSFIEKMDLSHRSTRSAKEEKVQEHQYGFTGLTPVEYGEKGYIFLVIQGVYPNSSAAKAGIKRGTEITRINGQVITKYNKLDSYMTLLYPSTTSTLKVTDYNKIDYTINSAPIYLNPVIHSQVTTIGKHKIGYLVYSDFDAAFDKELFNEFKNFKKQQVTDLILDFRYNGGGHLTSANLMASCIAGSSCVGKTLAYYRYNDDRMKEFDYKRDFDLFTFAQYDNLNNISLSDGGLNLPRVYYLVTKGTASASELVINSLDGIGIKPILIGTTTSGKNVGMEATEIVISTAKYKLYPITFQLYNAKNFGDYENGFTPDYILDEDRPYENLFDYYYDYGSKNEHLYAKAIELITGIPTDKSNTRSITRHIGNIITDIPETKRIGIIK